MMAQCNKQTGSGVSSSADSAIRISFPPSFLSDLSDMNAIPSPPMYRSFSDDNNLILTHTHHSHSLLHPSHSFPTPPTPHDYDYRAVVHNNHHSHTYTSDEQSIVNITQNFASMDTHITLPTSEPLSKIPSFTFSSSPSYTHPLSRFSGPSPSIDSSLHADDPTRSLDVSDGGVFTAPTLFPSVNHHNHVLDNDITWNDYDHHGTIVEGAAKKLGDFSFVPMGSVAVKPFSHLHTPTITTPAVTLDNADPSVYLRDCPPFFECHSSFLSTSPLSSITAAIHSILKAHHIDYQYKQHKLKYKGTVIDSSNVPVSFAIRVWRYNHTSGESSTLIIESQRRSGDISSFLEFFTQLQSHLQKEHIDVDTRTLHPTLPNINALTTMPIPTTLPPLLPILSSHSSHTNNNVINTPSILNPTIIAGPVVTPMPTATPITAAHIHLLAPLRSQSAPSILTSTTTGTAVLSAPIPPCDQSYKLPLDTPTLIHLLHMCDHTHISHTQLQVLQLLSHITHNNIHNQQLFIQYMQSNTRICALLIRILGMEVQELSRCVTMLVNNLCMCDHTCTCTQQNNNHNDDKVNNNGKNNNVCPTHSHVRSFLYTNFPELITKSLEFSAAQVKLN